MPHLMDGLTEMQMIRIVDDLVKGKTFEQATEFLDNVAFPEAIERNREYLTNRANDIIEASKPPVVKIEKSHKK